MGFWSTETMRGRLPELIDPYSSTRIAHCAYELSLGGEAYITKLDSNKNRVNTTLKPKHKVQIPPGQFAQLLTKESIEVPKDALGMISIKTKYKKGGLVNVSGFHVDPGYKGKLIFSVFNAGSGPIILEQGSPIFLLWYASLDNDTEDLYTKPGHEQITSEHIGMLKGPTYNPTALADKVRDLERHRRLLRNIWIGVVSPIVAAAIMWFLSTLYDLNPWDRESSVKEDSSAIIQIVDKSALY